MKDEHNQHEDFIKTPKQLIAAVATGFLVPVITIILLAQYVAHSDKVGVGSEGQSPEAVAARIKPVGDQGFTLKDAGAPKQLQTGENVYKNVCAACHTTGAAGAPKIGDNAAWTARIAQGYDTLLDHAVKGIRAMPPMGGNADLDNVDVARAVVYLANQSGAKFKEPEVKTAAAAPAPAAESAATPPAAAPAAANPTPAASASAGSAPAAAASAPAAANAASADAGKKLYEATCQACLGTCVAGAPKQGAKAAWAPRIQQGNAVLYEHAIKGFQGKAGVMPPKGGSSATDEDVKAAVDYMTAASK